MSGNGATGQGWNWPILAALLAAILLLAMGVAC